MLLLLSLQKTDKKVSPNTKVLVQTQRARGCAQASTPELMPFSSNMLQAVSIAVGKCGHVPHVDMWTCYGHVPQQLQTISITTNPWHMLRFKFFVMQMDTNLKLADQVFTQINLTKLEHFPYITIYTYG